MSRWLIAVKGESPRPYENGRDYGMARLADDGLRRAATLIAHAAAWEDRASAPEIVSVAYEADEGGVCEARKCHSCVEDMRRLRGYVEEAFIAQADELRREEAYETSHRRELDAVVSYG